MIQLSERAACYLGDCLAIMPRLGENVFDAIVTDPPYGLSFMGKAWDHGVPGVPFWEAALRVLKPGGHMLAFGGTRTFHRLTCAIEDAGFEIRDTLMWVYGTGFPKSHNLPGGWGTALKPAYEPIILARKPLDGTVAETVQRWGTGALNIDGCRVGTSKNVPASLGTVPNFIYGPRIGGHSQNGSESGHNPNIGRWPANLIHDGSEEVLAAFPDTGASKARVGHRSGKETGVLGAFVGQSNVVMGHSDDGGSAARFFYCAKAGKADRAGSKHPTVKPLALMRYLCRLITPPGGLVLDPFAGSGTTGQAAVEEGFATVLIEQTPQSVDDIKRRFV